MGQIDAEGFRNLDANGGFLPGAENAKVVNWHNAYAIRGVAYFKGGVGIVENPIVQILPEQLYQPSMASVPEPATIALMVGGSAALVAFGGYRRQKVWTDVAAKEK